MRVHVRQRNESYTVDACKNFIAHRWLTSATM